MTTVDRTYPLYGAATQQQTVLDQLQTLGCVHLIDLVGRDIRLEDEDDAGDARDALRSLRACRQRLRQTQRAEKFERDEIVRRAA